MHLDRNQ